MKISLLVCLAFFNVLQEVCGDSDAACKQRTAKNKCCVFPFTYDGKQHDTCIWGGPTSLHWCSTTENYDQDGQWDICEGVKCFICTSDVSWSDCESRQQPHTCPYRYDECLTLSKEEGATNTSKLFHKRCTSNTLCTAYNPMCEGPDVLKCDFSCCMGDLCNAASCYAKIASWGVLVLAAWVSFMSV